jgi:hypothetical protein
MVIGAPGEKVGIDEKARERTMPTSVFGTQAIRTSEMDGYDYVEVRSRHDGKEGRPKSYGGLSGAGLWRVGLNVKGHEATWDGSADLCGVAFLEM